MPKLTYDDRANLRANQKTDASSVPEGRAGKGKDMGGTANPRANYSTQPTSVPGRVGLSATGVPFKGARYNDKTV